MVKKGKERITLTLDSHIVRVLRDPVICGKNKNLIVESVLYDYFRKALTEEDLENYCIQ